MLMRLVAAVAAFGFLTAFAPAPYPKPLRKARMPQDDLARMQGTWKVVDYSRPGLKAAAKIRTSYTHVLFDQKQCALQRELNGQRRSSITYDFQIDLGSRKMEMTRDLGGNGLGGGAMYYQKAIYKFEGKRLTLMLGGLYGVVNGGGKPNMPELSFENPPVNAQIYTLERE